MEMLAGMSLGERLRSGGAMPLSSALRVARDICVALEVAHGAGVIHRDLKPDNIMLVAADGRTDYAKVLDFGIAKITGGPDAALTSSRTVLGTPGYVAPDVIMSGMTEDPRADLYAVGVMLFEMLAGRAPFQATSAGAMLVAQASGEPPLVSSLVAEAPAAVVELVRQLTSRRPDDRPPSARWVIDAIDAIGGGAPTAPLFGGGRAPAGAGMSTMPLSSLSGGVTTRPTGDVVTLTPSTLQLDQLVAPSPRRVSFVAAGLGLVAVAAITILSVKAFAPLPATPVVTTPDVIAAIAVVPPPVVAPVGLPIVEPVEPVEPVVAEAAQPPVVAAVAQAPVSDTKAAKPVKPRIAAVQAPVPVGPPPLTSALVKRGIISSVGKAPTCTNTNIKLAASGPGLLVDHCPSYKTIDGSHQVSLTVSPTGEVLGAKFNDDATNAKSLGSCVLSSLKGWKFPQFAGTEPVEITQRVTFEPCVPINNVCVF